MQYPKIHKSEAVYWECVCIPAWLLLFHVSVRVIDFALNVLWWIDWIHIQQHEEQIILLFSTSVSLSLFPWQGALWNLRLYKVHFRANTSYILAWRLISAQATRYHPHTSLGTDRGKNIASHLELKYAWPPQRSWLWWLQIIDSNFHWCILCCIVVLWTDWT